MSFKTRGSEALDKAQRRLALLKSIDGTLDLGHGLTVEAYNRMIEGIRDKLEAHNILLSDLNESRAALTQMDKSLAEMSERMLTGVMTKYGRNSAEYTKAGGSVRKRKSTPSKAEPAAIIAALAPTQDESTNGASNGKAKQPALN
jgi:hypothetical protein